MYACQESLELGTRKHFQVSRYGSAGVCRVCKTSFKNLCETADVSHSETLRMLYKKLT